MLLHSAVGSGVTRKCWTRLERLAKDKRPSLSLKVVTYGHKKFYNIGHCSEKLFMFSFCLCVISFYQMQLSEVNKKLVSSLEVCKMLALSDYKVWEKFVSNRISLRSL